MHLQSCSCYIEQVILQIYCLKIAEKNEKIMKYDTIIFLGIFFTGSGIIFTHL